MRKLKSRASLRLTEAERKQLEKIGGGNVTAGLRMALNLLFKQHELKPSNQ